MGMSLATIDGKTGRLASHCVEEREMFSAFVVAPIHQSTQCVLLLTCLVDAAWNKDPEAYRDALSRGFRTLRFLGR